MAVIFSKVRQNDALTQACCSKENTLKHGAQVSSPDQNCPPLRSFVLPMSSPDLKSHCPQVPFFGKEKSDGAQVSSPGEEVLH